MIRPELMPSGIEPYLDATRSWAAKVPRAFAVALGLDPATPIVPSPLFRLRRYSRLDETLGATLEGAESQALGFWFQREVVVSVLELEPPGDSDEWQILRVGAGTHVQSWIEAYENLGEALATDPREWTVWFARFETPGVRVVLAASGGEVLASPAGPARFGLTSGVVSLAELAARVQAVPWEKSGD